MAQVSMEVSQLRSRLHELKAGDSVLLTGTIYTARDAAHKRLNEILNKGEEFPFPLENAVLYYAGPTPEREGAIIGSCGPTTSCRMDPYTPRFISLGMVGMIGKGERSPAVVSAMKEHGCVYFSAIGGGGALAAKCIQSLEVVAFAELGCESVKKLYVKDFPIIVTIDVFGNNAYEMGRKEYLAMAK